MLSDVLCWREPQKTQKDTEGMRDLGCALLRFDRKI